MKLKISHKLFVANLGITGVLVIAILALTYVSPKSLMEKAVIETDIKVLDALVIELASDYAKAGTWQSFVQDRQQWKALATSQLIRFLPKMPFQPQAGSLSPVNFGPPGDNPLIPRHGHIDPPDLSDGKFFQEIGIVGFSTFVQRVALLDADRNVIIAPDVQSDENQFRKIIVNDEIVGWARMGVIDIKMDPMAQWFIERQLTLSSWVSIIGVILAALFSYVLARHITAPIKELTRGASRLAEREFDIQIDVRTGDELQNLATSFNRISQELKGYETRQKQWIMDISHELRTPLTILLGELDALRDGVSRYDNKVAASLREEAGQIRRLVDDLHELTDLERKDFVRAWDPVNINDLLDFHIKKYEQRMSDRDIRVTFRPVEGDPLVVGDRHRLGQVLQNLLENSCRYIESPGELYVLGSKTVEGVFVSFEDTGPGVAPRSLPKLFDRLYRTDQSRSRKTGGAGLGLAICKNIIDAHGGKIDAFHSSKGGLCVRIQLPVNDEK